MSGTIERADYEDAEAIAGLHIRAWRSAYRGILPKEVLAGMNLKQSANRRRERMRRPSSPDLRDWLLQVDGDLVGWAATGPARDQDVGPETHELYAIYLEPDRIGEGHGRALMDHCLRDAVERGYREMVMWVLTGNEKAQRFYEAAGFAQDERIEAIPFRDTGALKMRMVRSLV
jgi:ribosomal protein S18 acetylase RimI-like enzyme